MEDIIFHIPGGGVLRIPGDTPQEEIQRIVREAIGGDAEGFGAGLPESEFRGGRLSEPQSPPLLQGAVERFERGEQQPPLTFQQADPNWQPPPLGEGLRQLGDVAGQAGIQAGAGIANALRGGTAGLFEQGNAAIAGLGTMLFDPEHQFSKGYDWSLRNQRALMEETPEELRGIWETGGALAPAFIAGPAAMANMSLPAAMGTGAALGMTGGFAYPLATGQGGVEEALMGAGVGGAIGMAAPPLFHAGGAIAGRLRKAPQRTVSDLPASPVQWAEQADWEDLTGGAVTRNAPRVEQFDGVASREYIEANQEYYRAVGNRLYTLADEAGGGMPIGNVLTALDPLERQFRLQFDPELANALVGRLNHIRSVLKEYGDTVPVAQLSRLRSELSADAFTAPAGSNARTQLLNIRNTVDDQIDAATDRYPVAREMWSTVKQLDVLENLAHRATAASSRSQAIDYDRAFYNELNRIYRARSPREWGVFTPEQQQAIANVVEAGGPRALQAINQVFSRIFPSNLAQSIAGGVGVISGNPLLAAPIAASTADRVMTGAARSRALEALMGDVLPQGTAPAIPSPGFSMRPWPYATVPAQIGGATTGGGF